MLLTVLSVLVVAASALAVLHFTKVIDLTKVFSTEQTESTLSSNDKEDDLNNNNNEIITKPNNNSVL